MNATRITVVGWDGATEFLVIALRSGGGCTTADAMGRLLNGTAEHTTLDVDEARAALALADTLPEPVRVTHGPATFQKEREK